LKLPQECKKLKLKSKLTRWNKRLRVLYKRERLKMKLLLRKKRKNFIISKLSVNQLRAQVKLRQKPRLFLNNLKLKVNLKLPYQNLKPKLRES